ncbi:MAG: PEP-CTERM sorting domain-containing protein [Phycisphaeraceae bacterium]|nr:PEP-CTERM sorting domain-containing protein [Phycisphaeraceae bacterium]
MRSNRLRVVFKAVVWAVGALSSGLTGQAGAAVQLNLHQALADTKAVLASGGQANIVAIGDSLTLENTSWVPVFRREMQALYGNAGRGYQGFSQWSGGNFVYSSGWIGPKVNTDPSPHHSLDGLWNGATTANQSATFDSLAGAGATVELQYMTGPGYGRIEVADAAHNVLTIIDTNNTQESLGTWQYQFPTGQSRLWIKTLDDKPATILGMNNINQTPGARVHRVADGGWGVNNYIQRDWTFDAQLQNVDPDLIFVWIGQNDQAYNRTTYAARLNLLVDRLQATAPTAEIVLVGTKKGNTWLPNMVGAMEDVALARGLGFVDLYHTAGDAAFYQAQGYLQADKVHFSSTGGEYIGQLMFQKVFMEEGVNLQAGMLGDFNEDGLMTLSDVDGFRKALAGQGLTAHYGDVNEDGLITLSDIDPFKTRLLAGAGGAMIPEPGAVGLLALGFAAIFHRRRHGGLSA